MSRPRAAISSVLAISMIAGTALIVSAQDDEADPDPVGVIAIGHSGLTAESSDLERPWQPALEDSEPALVIIQAYEAEQARVCAAFARCRDDRGGPAEVMFDRSLLTDDGNHLNVGGRAHLAELRWPAVAELLGILADATTDGLSLVGLGDSIPGALGCFDPCRSYVAIYGELAAAALGRPLVTTNLATNDGLTSDILLQRVTHDQRHRDLLADADLITVQIGRNDWEGACMFDGLEVCMAGNRDVVEQDLRAILAEVKQLRGERSTAVRVLGYYDPFVGKAQTPEWWGFDPSDRDAFDAAYASALIDFNAMLCRVAEESRAICIDTHTLVNGPVGDIEAPSEPADGALVLGGDDQLHLTAAGHQLVAGAIAAAGFAPLG